jgi:hypothetical protein
LRIFSDQKEGFIEDLYLQQNHSKNLKYQGGFNVSKQEKALVYRKHAANSTALTPQKIHV